MSERTSAKTWWGTRPDREGRPGVAGVVFVLTFCVPNFLRLGPLDATN
jgi:hypothetical protein